MIDMTEKYNKDFNLFERILFWFVGLVAMKYQDAIEIIRKNESESIVNIYVVNSDWTPVKGYDKRRIRRY